MTSLSLSPLSSVQPTDCTAEVLKYIQNLPAAKRDTARRLFEARLTDCGEGFEAMLWYPEFDGIVFFRRFGTETARFKFRSYSGKRRKPDFVYTFGNPESLQSHLQNWFDYHLKRQRIREAEKAERAQWRHNLNIGDILCSQWGYEQTNVCYYQVVGLKGKTMASLKRISKQICDNSGLYGSCIPLPDSFVDEEVLTRRVLPPVSRIDPICYVEIDSFERAYFKAPVMVDGIAVYQPDNWTAWH